MKDKPLADRATFIGLAGAYGIVILALSFGHGSLLLFVDPVSVMIVIFGSLFVVMMKFTLKQFLSAWVVAYNAFYYKEEEPVEIIEVARNLHRKARIDGILALDGIEIENSFLKKGVEFVVDNVDPATIRYTLTKEMYQAVERHETGRKIFKALADVSPAMGMLGTLIGLVQMLSGLNDPVTIGPAMAVALLTTLYGAMLSNMFARPIADKLALRCKEERMIKMLIIDAVLGILEGEHPIFFEEMLMPYLPGFQREMVTEKVPSRPKVQTE